MNCGLPAYVGGSKEKAVIIEFTVYMLSTRYYFEYSWVDSVLCLSFGLFKQPKASTRVNGVITLA